MADQTHVAVIERGVDAWNSWRASSIERPNLSGADLGGRAFHGADFSNAILTQAVFDSADLSQASFSGAVLKAASFKKCKMSGANLKGAMLDSADFAEAVMIGCNFTSARARAAQFWRTYLFGSRFTDADLAGASLIYANLEHAVLTRCCLRSATLWHATLRNTVASDAILTDADLEGALLLESDFSGAHLSGANVYGVAAWGINLTGAKQSSLRITPKGEAGLWVDNLEVAQFVYLLLRNAKIRDVIDTVGRKAVLILGRFSQERMAILMALSGAIRELGYVPIVFDFERPTDRDFTETVRILAGLSLFVVVDLTNPRSSPLECQAVIPEYMIPFVPILQAGEEPFAMFGDLQRKHHDWVLDVLEYSTGRDLALATPNGIVGPALQCADRLRERRAAIQPTRRTADFM